MVDSLSISPADLKRLGVVIADHLASQPILVDSAGLAPLLSVSVETVKRYKQKGVIPHVRLGSRVLYQPEAVVLALTEASIKTTEASNE